MLMHSNYEIIMADGTIKDLFKWQRKMHPMLVGTNKITPHISIREIECENQFMISEKVLWVFEELRKKKGGPIKINSGFRTSEYQKELRKKGYRAAITSPHVHGYALDVDTRSNQETELFVAYLREIRQDFPWLRIGWKKYMDDGSTFVHFDVAPWYHRHGGPYDSKMYPDSWSKPIEW